MDKRPLSSKKWLAMLIGTSVVTFVWLVSLIVMAIVIEIATPATQLASIVIGFIGGIIMALITGQSVVDYKIHSSVSSNRREDVNIERKQVVTKNYDYDISIEKQMEKNYKDDPSYAPIGYSDK